jgi:hypothetical protein
MIDVKILPAKNSTGYCKANKFVQYKISKDYSTLVRIEWLKQTSQAFAEF